MLKQQLAVANEPQKFMNIFAYPGGLPLAKG